MRDVTLLSHDGVELVFRDHGGSGPDVLLLHGATRNLEDWGSLLPHLQDLRVVAMDQRFHGRSGGSRPTTPQDWLRDIEAVVDGLGMFDPYVVGWSMGGTNALLYAAEHAECPGVLDIDGYDIRQPEFYDEFPDERVREFLEGFAARSQSFVPQGDEGDDAWRKEQAAILTEMDAAWGVDPDVTRTVVDRAFEKTDDGRWKRKPPGVFWETAIADGLQIDTLGLLRRAACPVIAVVCTRPMPVPGPPGFFEARQRGVERHFRAIAAARPNVRVVTVDATHGVIHERPEEIASLVTALVSS